MTSIFAVLAAAALALATPALAEEEVCDVDGSGSVTMSDLVDVRASLGSQEGDEDYDPAADCNGDGAVDATDFELAAAQLGE